MSSALTFGAFNSNPLSKKYGEIATRSSKCGSKNFVYTKMYDDRQPAPTHIHRQSDVPWRDAWSLQRYRWMVHDFRMFGLWGALRKHYYIGESWRHKDEKIFVGKDENNGKYWLVRRNGGSIFARIHEPVDPHWFRGQSHHAIPAMWLKWMQGNTAHTPAQMKARGEYGHNSRVGMPLPFDIAHDEWTPLTQGGHYQYTRDPTFALSQGMLVNPERKVLQEAGFSRWAKNMGHPIYMPFCGVHDYSDELVEEYYRGQWAFSRRSKGNDHDEWKN